MKDSNSVFAIVPCNNLDANEEFYNKLGFKRNGWSESYRILFDGKGAQIHLQTAVKGGLVPGSNPFGIYYNTENVDELSMAFGKKPENTAWGVYEFAMSDPDETLVRVGWPSSLRNKKGS